MIFFKIGILVEIFAPPKIASTGFSPFFKTFLIDFTSLSKHFPKNLSLKNCATNVVEAWALWAVPNASFIKQSANFESSSAKPISPCVSSL